MSNYRNKMPAHWPTRLLIDNECLSAPVREVFSAWSTLTRTFLVWIGAPRFWLNSFQKTMFSETETADLLLHWDSFQLSFPTQTHEIHERE